MEKYEQKQENGTKNYNPYENQKIRFNLE